MAVLNVFHAAQVRLVMVAKVVQQVMQEKVMTKMPHNANNASWVKPLRWKVLPPGPPLAQSSFSALADGTPGKAIVQALT